MEDASSVDLDWFWRGWFFTTDHVDQSLASVKHYKLDSGNPMVEKAQKKSDRDNGPQNISTIRNRDIVQTYDEMDTTIRDFYTTYDPLESDEVDRTEYEQFVSKLSPQEKDLLANGKNYYELTIENEGGLMMPVIFQFQYEDGTSQDFKIPAEVWRYNPKQITKVIPTDKEVTKIILDPYLEIADVNTENNYYPPQPEPSRFDAFKAKRNPTNPRENPMQRARRASELTKEIKP
jgi:hypothetical protein